MYTHVYRWTRIYSYTYVCLYGRVCTMYYVWTLTRTHVDPDVFTCVCTSSYVSPDTDTCGVERATTTVDERAQTGEAGNRSSGVGRTRLRTVEGPLRSLRTSGT